MSALDELSQALTSLDRFDHAVRRRHRVAPARRRRRHRRRPGPHERPQCPRRRGHGHVRRRPHRDRHRGRPRCRRRPRRDRGRHQRRGTGRLGDGDGPSVGSVVFGAAATAGGGARVTLGTVSRDRALVPGPGGRRIGGSVEHTAPLAPGSSGGPLLDKDGRLVGINTNRIGEGFYLAPPADAALRTRVESLGRGELVSRPRLGIAVAPGRVGRHLRRSVGLPERDGVLVRAVEDDGPAAKAGDPRRRPDRGDRRDSGHRGGPALRS